MWTTVVRVFVLGRQARIKVEGVLEFACEARGAGVPRWRWIGSREEGVKMRRRTAYLHMRLMSLIQL